MQLVHGGLFVGVVDVLRSLRLVVGALFLGSLAWGLLAGAIVAALMSIFAISLLLGASEAVGRRTGRHLTRGQARLVGRALAFEADSGKRRRTISLDRLRSAMVVPASDGGRACQLVMRGLWGQRTALDFTDREDARALLHEMKMSPREESATFYFFFGLYVTVGADGVLLRWPMLGRQRFVPYAKILSVTSFFGFIELRLSGGDKYEIMTTTSKRSREQQQHQALLERIAHACVSYRAEHAEERAALLDRSGRSALGWIKDLGLLGKTGGGYRVASLPADTLWRVALDPAAKEETRIGAALALRSALDADGRQKLRIAAEASASPKMRVALDAAAEELTDEQLGEALDQAVPLRRRA